MTDHVLAARLRRAAYLEGDFVLRSGKHSHYYLDKYRFETQPALLRELAKRFATYVNDSIDLIAGPELGGVALAAATSLECNRPFIIVRNARKNGYGTGKLIEGVFERGQCVLVLEDIVTSGGQAIEACEVLSEQGATVAGIIAVIDREEGGMEAIRNAGFRCHALLTASDLGISTD